MTTHPSPLDLMTTVKRIELSPQISVADRLPIAGHPASGLPGGQPFADPLLHILRIGMHHHRAFSRQGLKRSNHRGQLHSVVGRGGFAAEQFALVTAPTQQGTPAARPGVSFAGAIGVDLNRCGH